ncbi:four-carbon acid sugar kinase family protein [Streptomyces luteocolor]|uniref:four-carbon acid sugar kinase family protein n=1 Tax=Streptomyces luteocolor TaxID=285500 RepID=UPI00099FE341|nr:four-carbon acid sugar kinase family protein [Streptomyces luteocolor]
MTLLDGPGPDIAILADDLTSAGDGAAPFRRGGLPARILFSAPALARDQGVTAVDLGSRVLDEAAAATRTERAARLCAASTVLFKTVDSTLRGHVAAEVGAAWTGSRRRAVVIAPAFPAEGRETVDAVQYVHGVPVHESDYAHDPVHPVRCADLAALFPDAALAGPGRATELPRLVGAGGLIVWSARTDADLDRLVASVPRPDDVLWVGSPGLAAALARRYAHPAGHTAPDIPRALRPLVVVGSANPATRRQLAALLAREDVQGLAVGDDPARTAEALRGLTAPVLTLRTPDARRPQRDAQDLVRSLAAHVRTLITERRADALVVTGGETATTVLRALDVTGMDLLDEPEPGVARGTPLDRPALPVLVKAGGFGDDDLLLRLCRLVRTPADQGEPA